MSDIGPNDWVEALRSDTGEYGFQDVTAGSLYRVARMVCIEAPIIACADCGDDGEEAFILDGDLPEDEEMGWCACGFRPVYRPRTDLIESLLAPAPALVPA